MSKPESHTKEKVYSFRLDDETDDKLTALVGLVSSGVVATKRRSVAIREAIVATWEARFGKGRRK